MNFKNTLQCQKVNVKKSRLRQCSRNQECHEYDCSNRNVLSCCLNVSSDDWRLVSKMEGKTNFSRSDGLTWLTLTPAPYFTTDLHHWLQLCDWRLWNGSAASAWNGHRSPVCLQASCRHDCGTNTQTCTYSFKEASKIAILNCFMWFEVQRLKDCRRRSFGLTVVNVVVTIDQLYSPSGRQIQRNEYGKINNK